MIFIPTTLPTGNYLSYHKVIKAEADFITSELMVIVSSWSSESEITGGGTGVITTYPLSFSAWPDVEHALVAKYDSPFYGGQVELNSEADLAAAKVRKWISIKSQRNSVVYGGFIWDGSLFDSSPLSQQQITSAVVLAQMALMSKQPFSITWTLADNSTRVLVGNDIINVGVALGAWVQEQFAKGTSLRNAIAASESIHEVEIVTW